MIAFSRTELNSTRAPDTLVLAVLPEAVYSEWLDAETVYGVVVGKMIDGAFEADRVCHLDGEPATFVRSWTKATSAPADVVEALEQGWGSYHQIDRL